MMLRIFTYLCAKSIQIAKKLVSWENGYKQMFIVLNSFEVLYLNLIGQGKYSNQILTKQQRCWSVVKNGHQDLPLCSKRVVAFKQKANYGQMKSEGAKYDHIQLKEVAMYLYKHIII